MIWFLSNFTINLTILILKLPFLDCDVPRSTSYGVYISQLICFARAPRHVDNFNTHNKLSTEKFLKKVIGNMNFAKTFLNFIDYTMILYLNSKLAFNLSCAKNFRNRRSMLTWCI